MVLTQSIDSTGLAIARALYAEELRQGRAEGVPLAVLNESFGKDFAEKYAGANAATLEAYLAGRAEVFELRGTGARATVALRPTVPGYVMHAVRDEAGDSDLGAVLDHGYHRATSAVAKKVLGHMSFHDAVLKGVLAVQLVLTKGLRELNERNETGKTPLMVAAGAAAAALDVVKVLVDHGADLAAEDEGGWTATCYAAHSGNTAILDYIRQQGGALNQRTMGGNTLLHIAAEQQHPETLQVLLVYLTGDVHAVNADGETALHLAAGAGCAASTALLTAAMDHSMPLLCHKQTTAAHRAALAGHVDCLRTIAAADPTTVHVLGARGRHPVHNACVSGAVPCVDVLIECQSAFVPDNEGRTPLHIAAASGFEACLASLLRAVGGLAASQAAATIDHAAGGGATALHEACRAGAEGCATQLLKAGARVDLPLAEGHLAVHTAAECDAAGVLTVLLDAHPELVHATAAGSKATPLLAACAANAAGAAKLLLGRGAEVNTKDARGNTAFLYAARDPLPALFEHLCFAEGLHSSTLDAANDDGEVLAVLLRREAVAGKAATDAAMKLCDGCGLHLLQTEEAATREGFRGAEDAAFAEVDGARQAEYDACCLEEEMTGYVEHRHFSYEQLKLPGSVLHEGMINVAIREYYLTDEEFLAVFGVEKDRYRGLAQHKKDAKKREVGLLAVPEEDKPAG